MNSLKTVRKEKEDALLSLLEGKTEVEQRRVKEVITRTGLTNDDPLLLLLISFDGYFELVSNLATDTEIHQQLISKKTDRLTTLLDLFIESSKALECRIKGQVPRSFSNSGLLIKELLLATIIAFLAGGFFFKPLLGLGFSTICNRFPGICEVQE
ncbi:MAG: hypothetical protein F6K19_40605 [Cyanothece sp. SIO1E1]|nr:hypothetical protein [Cyanothece sp. SIO1E1]